MEQYLKQVDALLVNNPNWRKGQTYFNALHLCNPILANKVRGSLLDPFYKDSNILAFLEWLTDNWE